MNEYFETLVKIYTMFQVIVASTLLFLDEYSEELTSYCISLKQAC